MGRVMGLFGQHFFPAFYVTFVGMSADQTEEVQQFDQ